MNRFKNILFLAVCLPLISICRAQQKTTSGNPIADGWYADPDGVIFGNTYWVFPTFSAKYEDQVFLDAFSSADLVHWEKHHAIVDTSKIKWAKKAMWAPCIMQKGGKYFLFFSANDIQSPERKGLDTTRKWPKEIGGIGIAVSSNPGGPYKDYLGKPLIDDFYNKAQPIDQDVFKDDDGQYYIIYGGWGRCNIARLNNDFTGLKKSDDGSIVKEITPKGYVEGPTMFKRKGVYYLMWSEGNWTDETYKVAYATASSPFGPFEKKATVLKADSTVATGAGHHSVFNIPGTDDWYIVYHRRPIPNKGRDHRVVCIDRMYFNEDGTIQNVKMTFEGVQKRVISKEQ
ncbi:MAG: glycoside hydrolase family 43 protein [Bacteroidetes bacterium]|nr:glycoside hydrolase family 43 protein [Bacteroidota bacterium]